MQGLTLLHALLSPNVFKQTSENNTPNPKSSSFSPNQLRKIDTNTKWWKQIKKFIHQKKSSKSPLVQKTEKFVQEESALTRCNLEEPSSAGPRTSSLPQCEQDTFSSKLQQRRRSRLQIHTHLKNHTGNLPDTSRLIEITPTPTSSPRNSRMPMEVDSLGNPLRDRSHLLEQVKRKIESPLDLPAEKEEKNLKRRKTDSNPFVSKRNQTEVKKSSLTQREQNISPSKLQQRRGSKLHIQTQRLIQIPPTPTSSPSNRRVPMEEDSLGNPLRFRPQRQEPVERKTDSPESPCERKEKQSERKKYDTKPFIPIEEFNQFAGYMAGCEPDDESEYHKTRMLTLHNTAKKDNQRPDSGLTDEKVERIIQEINIIESQHPLVPYIKNLTSLFKKSKFIQAFVKEQLGERFQPDHWIVPLVQKIKENPNLIEIDMEMTSDNICHWTEFVWNLDECEELLEDLCEGLKSWEKVGAALSRL
jgi:hypothetical protein